MVVVVEGGGLGWVFDWTANLSLLDPGGSGDHATSHYSNRTPTPRLSSVRPHEPDVFFMNPRMKRFFFLCL